MNKPLPVELVELNQVVVRMKFQLQFDYQPWDELSGFRRAF
ncbi:MAG: hypothetical protein R3B84_19865 [Zavarzinella sp.]